MYFLFKRQQYEYLTKSVALASGALLLTSAATAVGLLFAKDAIELRFSAEHLPGFCFLFRR